MMKRRCQLPLVIQMPITSRCNSRCKTCNVWKSKSVCDIDSVALKESLKDPFFSEVRSIGLNGGEFTLMPSFLSVVDAVLVLPKLSNIYLISNGLFPKRLFDYLREAKMKCEDRGVSLSFCLSIDGVGPVHETVRGIPNCFSKTKEILDELYNNKQCYCDSFSVGCTLSKYNIGFVKETEDFFSCYEGLDVEYHLAVPNKRIGTFDDYEDYYVLNDEESRLLAAEFFYERYKRVENERLKRQCFSNFFFLKQKGHGRLCKCGYLDQDITIDQDLNLSLCATASDVIGNLKENSASYLIRSKKRRQVRKSLKKQCNKCIHYSYYPWGLKGRLIYIKELLKDKYVFEYYELCSDNKIQQRIKHRLSLTKRFVYDFLKLSYKLIWKSQ